MMVVETPKAPYDRPRIWPLSIQAYHALGELGLIPEKTELFYGQVYHKTPKSPLHRLLFMRLLDQFQHALPPGPHLQPEQPIICGDSELEPDLSVIRGSINDYQTEHPHSAELVVEICVSGHDYDRSKLRAYAHAGIKEAWFVLAPEQQIEVYRQPVKEQYLAYLRYDTSQALTSTSVPELTVSLERLFAQ